MDEKHFLKNLWEYYCCSLCFFFLNSFIVIYKSHAIHLLKMYNSVFFSVFTDMFSVFTNMFGTSWVVQMKCLPTIQETWVWSLGQEDPLEKEMAPHSSTLAWKIPCTEERGRLQSMGSQRVRHNWVTSLSLSQTCSTITTVNFRTWGSQKSQTQLSNTTTATTSSSLGNVYLYLCSFFRWGHLSSYYWLVRVLHRL